MNENFMHSSDSSGNNQQQQFQQQFHSPYHQQQMAQNSMTFHSPQNSSMTNQNEMNSMLYLQQQQQMRQFSQQQQQTNFFNDAQSQQEAQNNFDLMKMHHNGNSDNVGKYMTNGHMPDNDTNFQGHQQQMAVSSPSVSSTADMNGGMPNGPAGQNGVKHQQQQFGLFDGFPQQPHMDPSAYNGQQLNNNDYIAAQQHQQAMLLRQQQQQMQQFCPPPMNGQLLLNGHQQQYGNGNVRFPPAFPQPMGSPMGASHQQSKRAFLFNSGMANNAAQFMQQNFGEDMAIWHLKYCSLTPSTSRSGGPFEQQKFMNDINKSSQSPAPSQNNARGVKRKASAQTTTTEPQQPHSMSLSPHDARSSYTPLGHPQSVPLVVNHLDHHQQQQQNNVQNELCDSSTNGDTDLFKRPSSQMPPNGAIMPNYLQNASFGQMDENPLKKMEIMTSKTLNEPSCSRMMRLNSEEDQQQQSAGAADITKQEKIRKLQEIEKSLQSFTENSPTYPHPQAFPDPSQFRPPFFPAPPGHIMQGTQQMGFRPMMGGPFPPQMRMAMMNLNQQQMCGTMAEQQQQHAGLMQNNFLVPSAGPPSEIGSQRQWLPHS